MKTIIENIGHLTLRRDNKNGKININDRALNKLTFLYTEDIVMLNQFLNTTTTVDEIIKQIKLEKDFIHDVKQYQHQLTYLL